MTEQTPTSRDLLEYLGHMTSRQLFGLANRSRKTGFNTAEAVKKARAELQAKGYSQGWETGYAEGLEAGSERADINAANDRKLQETNIQNLEAQVGRKTEIIRALHKTQWQVRAAFLIFGILAGAGVASIILGN